MRIENSTALVTGTNRGVGMAFVQALLDGGAKRVYTTARNPETLGGAVAAVPGREYGVESGGRGYRGCFH